MLKRDAAGNPYAKRCSRIHAAASGEMELARRMLDQRTLDGITALIIELKAKKAELHPE